MSIPRKKFPSELLAALARGPRAYVHDSERDTNRLDRADAAYRAEYERWSVRRVRPDIVKAEIPKPDKYELVRLSGSTTEITPLAKREAPDYSHAESWLNTYRGRAAMRAALEAL